MNGLQSLPQWVSAFNHPSDGMLGVLNAIQVGKQRSSVDSHVTLLIQNIGALAGYPFAPYLSDGIGRRQTVFFGAVIMLSATALQTTAQSIGMFIGARFLIGFGLSFASEIFSSLVSQC